MLGHYREYSNGQAGAIEHVRMLQMFAFSLTNLFGSLVVEYEYEIKEMTIMNSFGFFTGLLFCSLNLG